jgi:hypothetical protein
MIKQFISTISIALGLLATVPASAFAVESMDISNVYVADDKIEFDASNFSIAPDQNKWNNIHIQCPRDGGDPFIVYTNGINTYNAAHPIVPSNDYAVTYNNAEDMTCSIRANDGLNNYWSNQTFDIPLGYDIRDKTSNNNNLTNNGVMASSNTSFLVSSISADLESSESDYITAPDSAPLSITGNLTLETWVKFESLPASGDVMQLISKFYDSGNQRSYVLGLWNDSGTYKLRFSYSTDGTYQDVNAVATNWTPSTGTWYHVASVLDTSVPNVKFYVSGSQQGATITSNTGTSIYNSTGT